ncbi:Ppx/GppA phosphatase family protein [Desulfuribacillus alkaliarsenatis]|uniref:Uncharacterized protein n=1 Tax=Desulfuribacillus alkaliarsenatis TaxID=766136 RepID=A0A1E5G0T6_9FIRM|nr:Ppx/GppA phosphatase family protein [Desulfuribacillus alkaliarsenatis]OEF96481.1 hypothetical protein BHF68_07440 [Desulfuribacillus alkaliarsenatis]
MEKHIAIIDMGSNSVRLVIYYINTQGAIYKVDDLKRSIRLSGHLDEHGRITDVGVELAIQCLKQYKQLCDARDVQYIKGVTTAALRQAQNRDEVIFEIFRQTDIQFEVLSGEEEARYGYLAVRSSMDIEEAFIVDIGGGSTEITYMKERNLVHSISLPYGAVNIMETFFKQQEVLNKDDLKCFYNEIKATLKQIPWLKNKRCPVVGLGGTARTIASIHQYKTRYSFNSIHNYKMDTYDVEHIFHLLRRTPLSSRSQIQGLSSGREDIILGGVAMYTAVMNYIDVDEFYISTQGIRDGICLEILKQEVEQDLDEDIVSMHIKRFAHYYKINTKHAEHVMHLSVELFRQLMQAKILPYTEKEARLLAVAAFLHDIGRTINVYNTANHTFYLLSNVNLPGLSHRERLIVALIASYKKAKILRSRVHRFDDILNEQDEQLIKQLGVLLQFTRSLDRTASKQVEGVTVKYDGKKVTVECLVKKKRSIEIDLANEYIKHFRKHFGHLFEVKALKK